MGKSRQITEFAVSKSDDEGDISIPISDISNLLSFMPRPKAVSWARKVARSLVPNSIAYLIPEASPQKSD